MPKNDPDKSNIDANYNRPYWWFTTNPDRWAFSNISVGDTQPFTLKTEKGTYRNFRKHFIAAKKGDLAFGYQSGPNRKLVAICEIAREQNGEDILVRKIEDIDLDISVLQKRAELATLNPIRGGIRGTMFRLENGEGKLVMALIRGENPPSPAPAPAPKPKPEPLPTPRPRPEVYGKTDFLKEVFMSDLQYDTLVSTLKSKKNIILKGVPGVGKTFAARRLAYSMMGEKDDERVGFVQFHQNYSYEDFVMGYKPKNGGGYDLQNGVFYEFCKKAKRDGENDYFFIIDEINRGNTSKIFGELLMLIENDHREEPTALAYDKELLFSVPKNLYIIGMMNTADRSLAMIDYALRRRFSFIEMEPAFDTAGFKKLNKENFRNETFAQLIREVEDLNEKIAAEKSLGPGFKIGHSYFCAKEEYTYEKMYAVVNYEILPLLEEYCFDSPDKLKRLNEALCEMFPKGSLKRE